MDVKPEIDAIQLDRFLPYQISLLADITAKRTAAIAKRHEGLNLSHWRVLAAIAEKPGRTANEVVAVTPMDKGIVSRAVNNLIDMKLVSRKASQEDGRIGHLFLTRKGMRQYSSMAAEVREVDEEFRSALSSEECKHLSRILKTLITNARTRTGVTP